MNSRIAEGCSSTSATTTSKAAADAGGSARAVRSSLPHANALPFRARLWVAPAMVLVDVLALQLCVAVAFLARQSLAPWLPIELHTHHYTGIAAGALVLPVIWMLVGLYPGYGVSAPERLRRRVLATAAIFSVLFAWDYLVQDNSWSRGILLLSWALATVTLPIISELAIRFLVRAGVWGQPVLLVGHPARAGEVIDHLRAHPGLGLVPVGFLTNESPSATDASEEAAASRFPSAVIEGIPCLGLFADANQYAEVISTLLILQGRDVDGALDDMTLLSLSFPHIILVPRLSSGGGLWVTARDLGGTAGLEVKKNLLIPNNVRIKRFLDLLIALPAGIMTVPVLAILAIAVIVVSPGKPFYAQVREGRGGQRFRMLKLRTMYPDADLRLRAYLNSNPDAEHEWKAYFKLQNDPRILPVVGNFLRKSSLDELPQIWNVIRGEMSLVGPRPFPHYHLESFEPEFRDLRRSVYPGLTGLWQVEARSNGDLAVQERLDTFYIRNWSIWLDIWLIIRTFSAVFKGSGAR